MTKQVFFFILLALFCCFPSLVNASLALALGGVYTFTLGNPNKRNTNLWGSILLRSSVVGLGFGINISVLVEAGKENAGTTAFFVLGALGLGVLAGKFLKINDKIALLIASGTAICGGSAIAAVGSVIKADSNQLAVSTGIVFLLNAIALFIFPSIGHYFGLSQIQFGTWAAIAIHDMSSVVGAASKYGDTALNIASVTKMLRVIWIIPLSLLLVLGIKQSRESFKIPVFILGFVVASCVKSFLPDYQSFFQIIYLCSKQAMVVSLFFIGSSISIENIKQVGGKVILQAVSVWLIVCVASMYYVKNFQL